MPFDLDKSVAACERQNHLGMVKIIEDVDRYRTIFDRVKPDLIIECGTFSGMSALWFADASGARVITIDTADQVSDETKSSWNGRVRQVIASSTSLEAREAVLSAVTELPGASVMLVLDSDHSGPHVAAEMSLYARFVTPGSYMVVEDGILRYLPTEERAFYDGDPLDAIRDWFNSELSTDWVTDREIEDMHVVTLHINGWLRKT